MTLISITNISWLQIFSHSIAKVDLWLGEMGGARVCVGGGGGGGDGGSSQRCQIGLLFSTCQPFIVSI